MCVCSATAAPTSADQAPLPQALAVATPCPASQGQAALRGVPYAGYRPAARVRLVARRARGTAAPAPATASRDGVARRARAGARDVPDRERSGDGGRAGRAGCGGGGDGGSGGALWGEGGGGVGGRGRRVGGGDGGGRGRDGRGGAAIVRDGAGGAEEAPAAAGPRPATAALRRMQGAALASGGGADATCRAAQRFSRVDVRRVDSCLRGLASERPKPSRLS